MINVVGSTPSPVSPLPPNLPGDVPPPSAVSPSESTPSTTTPPSGAPLAPKKKTPWRSIIAGVVLFITIVGAGIGFYLTQQNQDIRQQAASKVNGAECTSNSECASGNCQDVPGARVCMAAGTNYECNPGATRTRKCTTNLSCPGEARDTCGSNGKWQSGGCQDIADDCPATAKPAAAACGNIGDVRNKSCPAGTSGGTEVCTGGSSNNGWVEKTSCRPTTSTQSSSATSNTTSTSSSPSASGACNQNSGAGCAGQNPGFICDNNPPGSGVCEMLSSGACTCRRSDEQQEPTPTPTPATTTEPTPTSTPTPTPTPTDQGGDDQIADAGSSNQQQSTPTPTPEPVVLPSTLPETGPEDWLKYLQIGLGVLGVGALLLLFL